MARVRNSFWKKTADALVQSDIMPVIFKQYINFGTNAGETGYGFRDNAGVIQFKNSGGAWSNLGSGVGGGDFMADGSVPMAGDLDLNGNDLNNVNLIIYQSARGKVTAGGNLGTAETVNFSSETNYTGTLDSNITFTFTGAVSGDEMTLFLTYDGTAQRTITWPTITWLDNASGAAPTTPSAAGKTLVVTIRYIGTTYYASATGNYAVYA